MVDPQALFEKFLNLIETTPALPEYLAAEPTEAVSFDPYQMVAEWIALRHELKQQGKLLQASQNTLQQTLAGLQAENLQLQHQLETQQPAAPDQQSLWRDLLTVVDVLDQACAHWQAQIDAQALDAQSQSVNQPVWQRWLRQLLPAEPESASLRDILVSNQEGVALIRRSLLDVLRQRQVIPIEAQGQPFDPKIMYAVGRQASTSVPENTVIQEAVRGYWWGDQVLREAQVIVSVRKE
ncbi:MAG TPA: nucleotide exchange factor GrpE [Coleofasciculaceae cyanobacterium]